MRLLQRGNSVEALATFTATFEVAMACPICSCCDCSANQSHGQAVYVYRQTIYIYNKLYNYKQFQGWACLSMFEQLHQLSTPMIPSIASRNSGRQGVKWARWWGAKLPQHWKHTMNQNNQKASKKNVILVHSMFKLDDGWPESEKDVFQAALSMVVVKDSRWIVGEFYWWILYELWKDMM